MKGLGQIVIRPKVQTFDPVLNLGFCGQQKDRRPAALAADLPEHIQSAFDRHHDVQNNAVILSRMNIIKCLRPVIDGIHLITMVFQNIYDRFGHSRFVFRKQ